MPKQGVFFCDLSASQKALAQKASNPTELSFIGAEPNLEWELIPKSLNQVKVDDLTEDLLAFASHLYQADRLLKRPADDKDRWVREFELHVGVHDESLWNDLANELAKILKIITRDVFHLFFYRLEGLRPSLLLPMTVPSGAEAICVFSTRFNSAFGMASAQENLIASVRYGPDRPKDRQIKLIDTIGTIQRANTNAQDISFVAFRLTPVGLPSVERTQRTLGFLQFALAACLARRFRLTRVQLFDDAVSSYHLRPLQICGPGYAVRDTRPDFLWQALEFFKNLDANFIGIGIQNLFQFSTATDILDLSKHWNAKDRQTLLTKTDSCLEKELAKALRPNWNGAVPHCGCCFPCKLRRLAALAAGLESESDYSAYAINPLDDLKPNVLQNLSKIHAPRVREYHIKGLKDFRNYLSNFQTGSVTIADPYIQREIYNLSWDKFILDIAPPNVGPPTPSHIFQRIIDVHARFNNQVKAFL
jgi:hypothetical protein